MTPRNAISLLARTLLEPFSMRLVNLRPSKVRGIDPVRDLSVLTGRKPDPLIFDVGANDGETVQEFLSAFPKANIVAFEPDEACCALLRRRFASPRVVVENVAVGSGCGSVRLNQFSGNRLNSVLPLDQDPENPMIHSFAQIGSTDVKLQTLDGYAAEHNIGHIDILKSDTQGYELEVLRGATRLLQAGLIRAVIVEVNFVPMYVRQASFIELHTFLSSFGYRLVDFYNQVRIHGATDWCDACYVAPSVPGVANAGNLRASTSTGS